MVLGERVEGEYVEQAMGEKLCKNGTCRNEAMKVRNETMRWRF